MYSERPKYDRIEIGRVNPHTSRVGPHELRLGVVDQLERLFSAEFLGGVFVYGGALVTRDVCVRSELGFYFKNCGVGFIQIGHGGAHRRGSAATCCHGTCRAR